MTSRCRGIFVLQRFHDVAYMADSRRDLLDAINDFLQDSIVLPPGEYNRKTLLPIVDMARKKQQAKRARRPTKDSNTCMLTNSYFVSRVNLKLAVRVFFDCCSFFHAGLLVMD